MKKHHLLLLSLLFSGTAMAWNGYKDDFYVSSDSPRQTHVISAELQSGDVRVNQANKRHFRIRDVERESGKASTLSGYIDGYARVSIGVDENNECTLVIGDGTILAHPLVENITCRGDFTYRGIDYKSYNNYYLRFSHLN